MLNHLIKNKFYLILINLNAQYVLPFFRFQEVTIGPSAASGMSRPLAFLLDSCEASTVPLEAKTCKGYKPKGSKALLEHFENVPLVFASVKIKFS